MQPFLSSSEKPGLQTGQSPPRPPPPGDPPRYNLDLDHGPLTQLQDQLVVNLREPPCYHGAAPPAAPSPAPGSSRAPETPPSPARQTSIRPCCLRAAEPQAAPRRDPSWPAPWARKLAEALPAAYREGERCRCTGRQSGGVDDRLDSVTEGARPPLQRHLVLGIQRELLMVSIHPKLFLVLFDGSTLRLRGASVSNLALFLWVFKLG